MASELSDTLLTWYDAHRRDLPWRGIHDAYATWVSETMLQQTRVETVIPYYLRFLAAYPTVDALASAASEDVLKLWEGLGYYRRAQNLHRGAQQVVSEWQGQLPRTVPELLTISGIGSYTAGAIASIAFDQPVPAVDGNVIRVISRVIGIRENVGIPSVRRRLDAEAATLVPVQRPGDFNQALMDLGATLCVPGTPNCEACPLCSLCDAYAVGDAEDLPDLPRKNPPRVVPMDVCLILHDGCVLMHQRTETLLQGLWVFGLLDGHASPSVLQAAVKKRIDIACGAARLLGEGKHVFTHQVWEMKLYALDAATSEAPVGWQFVSRQDMAKLTIPTAMRAAVKALEGLI